MSPLALLGFCTACTKTPRGPGAPQPIKASYLTNTQMIHPIDAHIARLMLMAKIQGHGDEYRRPCEFP
jgi:hypothetical protein